VIRQAGDAEEHVAADITTGKTRDVTEDEREHRERLQSLDVVATRSSVGRGWRCGGRFSATAGCRER
jgi:hypothetical protein